MIYEAYPSLTLNLADPCVTDVIWPNYTDTTEDPQKFIAPTTIPYPHKETTSELGTNVCIEWEDNGGDSFYGYKACSSDEICNTAVLTTEVPATCEASVADASLLPGIKCSSN